MGDVVDHAIAYIDKAISQLTQAYVVRDWDAIQALDEKLRVGFFDYTQQLQNNRNETLLARLQQLIGLYREVIASCEEHRGQVRDQILCLNNSQRGSHAYASVSNFAHQDQLNQPWQRR